MDDGGLDEEAAAAAAANAGLEVPLELLVPRPSRTLHCTGLEFRRYRSLARTSRRRTVLPIISPLDKLPLCWGMVSSSVDLTYTAFLVALSVGFNHQTTPGAYNFLGVCDWVGSCVYLLDMCFGFHVGFIAQWGAKAVVVRDARAVAWFYIRHGTFWVDLVASIPFFVQLVLIFAGYSGHVLRMLYTLRLLRLVRVIRLLRDMQPGSIGGPMRPLVLLLSPRAVLLFALLFSLAVLVNLLGCLWWNIALDEGLENSWAARIDNKDFDLLTASDPARWLVSCYFALTTLVTIGYGDITAATIGEVALVMLFEVVGVAFFGYLLQQVGQVLEAASPRARRLEAVKAKLQDVEERMQTLGLSAQLKRSIRSYYAFRWHPEANTEAGYMFFEELPPKLCVRLLQQRQQAALAHLAFWPPDLDVQQRKAAERLLAAASSPVLLRAGQQLQDTAAQYPHGSEDRLGPAFYILEEGEMQPLLQGSNRHTSRSTRARLNFSGPAVVGLAALFSPAACQQACSRGRVGADSEVSDDDGESSDGDGSLSSGHSRAADLAAWEQHAVALSDCHVWRISCRQLYATLRQRQPAVLLFFVERLLATLGVRSAGAADQPGVPPAPPVSAVAEGTASPTQQRGGGLKHGVVDRLLQLQVELEAAVAQSRQNGGQGGKSAGGGMVRSSLATTNTLSTDSSWHMDTSTTVELSSVSVTADPGRGTSVLAAVDVWRTD